MPALVSITKVRLENLPQAIVRVKFRAGTAGGETIARRVNPDGSVEWSETLEFVVHDLNFHLVAVVSQENSSGGWSLVPGGRFEGALVTALPNDWHGASNVSTDPTLHAQLSVEMEDGLQRDTRLPPYAGMDKSGGGYRASTGGSGGGSAARIFGAGQFMPGGRGERGGRGGPRMDRAVSGDSSGVTFGRAHGMGAPSGSFGYVDALGSPEVYFDARSGEGASWGEAGAGAGGVGGASIELSSSSGASSLGGGLVTATAVAVPDDPDAIAPSAAPVLRRASTSSSTYSVPPRGGSSRRFSGRNYGGGWVQRSGSQDGSFRSSRSSVRMSMSDMGSFNEGSGATTAAAAAAAAEAEQSARPAPADGHLPSPVGTYRPSRLLDEHFQLDEKESRADEQGYDSFSPAYKRPSLTEAMPGMGSFGAAAREERGAEERTEEVKTDRPSSDEYQSLSLAAGAGGLLPPGAERKSWFYLRRRSSTRSSRSRGSSAEAASASAAGSSETRSSQHSDHRDGRSVSMSVSSTASPAGEQEKEELEPARAGPPPPAPRQAKGSWKKAGRATGAFVRSFSKKGRKRPAPSFSRFEAVEDAIPFRPSAPPVAGAPPSKLFEASELSARQASSSTASSRPPPTAPPSYEQTLREGLLRRRTPGAPAGESGTAAPLHPELARSRSRSRSRSSSLGPAAAAASAAAAAAAESPVGAEVLPTAPAGRTGLFLPSAPTAAPESPRRGWRESPAPPLQPSSVDDELAAAVKASMATDALQERRPEWEEAASDMRRTEGKEETVVETSLQGTALAAAAAPIAAAAAPASPAPPLLAASSETGEDSSDSGLIEEGGPIRGDGGDDDSADNLYDMAGALGGRRSPPPDRGEGMAAPESPAYSPMAADNLDGSGRVDAPITIDRDSLTLYPEVRRRQQQHLEPMASRTSTASEVTNVEPGFSGTQPRQMVSRQLPPQSTSVSSESASISGNMSLRGNNTRAVPSAASASASASNDGRSGRVPRQRSTTGDRDKVIFSCFAPPAVKPGTTFHLKVMAYLRQHADDVLREALSEGAAEAGRPEGMSIAKGKRVSVELLLPEDKFRVLPLDRTAPRPSVSDFVWTGEKNAARFRIGCMPGIDPGRVKCEALVIEGSRVKRLSFDIEVAGPGFVFRALDDCSPDGEVDLDAVMREEEGNIAEVPFEELHFVGELGHGVQGVTSHYRWHDKDVAVKSLASQPDFSPSSGPTRNGLKHEATILSLLGHHPNVVEFYGLCRQGDESIHIVTKLEEGGSIEDALGSGRKTNGPNGGGRVARTNGGGRYGNGNGRSNDYGSRFDGHVRAAWARDVACGLANTHSAGVLHNDIAARNALLSSKDSESRALLCDFGLSRFLRGGLQRSWCIDTQLDHERWPLRQMPCESFSHPYPLTVESDSWMYGIFLYELFAGEEPWAGLSKHEVKRLVMEGKRPPKAPEMLKDRGNHLVKLYNGCLSKDCEKRPSLDHVVNELSTNFTPMSASWENGA